MIFFDRSPPSKRISTKITSPFLSLYGQAPVISVPQWFLIALSKSILRLKIVLAFPTETGTGIAKVFFVFFGAGVISSGEIFSVFCTSFNLSGNLACPHNRPAISNISQVSEHTGQWTVSSYTIADGWESLWTRHRIRCAPSIFLTSIPFKDKYFFMYGLYFFVSVKAPPLSSV